MLSLTEIIEGLENADRIGSEVDRPEGSRCIQISDTLAREIIATLKKHSDDQSLGGQNA